MRTRARWLFLFLAVTGARGAVPAPVTDPAAVRAHYEQIVTRPEFRESDETLADLHWDDWLSQWVAHLVARFPEFTYASQLSTAARALVVVMTLSAMGGLIYLLVKLSRRRRGRRLDEAETPLPGRMFLSPLQYDRQLRRALAEQDWSGAWRAAWLQLLARLENRQLVEADRSRTNREYLAQLRARQLPGEALPLLARMVDDYDRAIYGMRPIDEANWAAFRDRMAEITLMLGLRERGAETPP